MIASRKKKVYLLLSWMKTLSNDLELRDVKKVGAACL